MIGPHVQAGHYDLIGPNGEIILPAIWEKVIEPDWSVTMHMWPMEQRPPINPAAMGRGGAPPNMHGRMQIPMQHQHQHHPGVPPANRRPMGGGPVPQGPPPPPNFPGNIPMRPPGGGVHMGNGRMPQGVNIVDVRKPKKSSSSKPKGNVLGSFFTGKPSKSKK